MEYGGSLSDFQEVKTPNYQKEDFDKLDKLRAYESKSWLYASSISSKVVAPYIQTFRKTYVEIPSPEVEPSKGVRISDTIELKKDIWDHHVFQTLKTNLLTQKELIIALLEAASKLKTVTASDIAIVYIIDPITRLIYRMTKSFESIDDLENWKVGPGSVLAAFVADINEFIITDDVYGDTRFPKALDCNDMIIESAMAVPVATPNKKVKVVLEFARTTHKKIYTWNDLNSVISTSNWIGHAIFSNELANLKFKHTSIIQYVMSTISKHLNSYETALAEIMVFVKNIFGAERVAFFLMSTDDKRHIYTDFFEEIKENKAIAKQRRILINEDDLVVGKAFFSQIIVNVKLKGKEILKTNVKYVGKRIRTTLCLPIIREHETVGVFQLIDKPGETYFTNEDEKMIKNFEEYFLIIINFISMTRNMENKECELTINKELLVNHFKPCVHDEKEINKTIENIPENFMTLMWYPSKEDLSRLPQLAKIMFREVLCDDFMNMNNMSEFIITVKKFYRPSPFHNFQHAFISAHAMANIITRNQNLFSTFEKTALMIASFCHDIDHRGYTNRFIEITKHPLSYLYKSSPLENHHFAITEKIMEQCKICNYLQPNEYKKLLREIHNCILATDLESYVDNRKQLVKTLKNKTFSWSGDAYRNLVKSLLMAVCDFSSLTKPYCISKTFTEAIYKEFYNQGDMEKLMGLTPHPTMDRNKKDKIPENQVEFLNSVVIPSCYVISKLIPNTAEFFERSRILREQWRDLMNPTGEDVWYPDKSFLDKYAYIGCT